MFRCCSGVERSTIGEATCTRAKLNPSESVSKIDE